MKINLYLSTAVAGLMMVGGEAYGQCVSSQDCASLGYTKSSCPDGNGVKCPFGNAWFCVDLCGSGYKYTCSGTGYAGGVGSACGGKYTSCTCASKYNWSGSACTACGSTYKYTCNGTNQTGGVGTACGGYYKQCACKSGYDWENGACKERQPDYAGCAIGTLFYSDNTCSSNKVSGKTILGVVIMEKTASQMGWIMTINPIRTGIAWSTEYVDIPGLNNITSESRLTDIQASCTNTDVITKYGNSSTYPAAWAAKNYKPSGTPSGKSWCLPSGGLLKNSLDNKTNLDRINAGISTAGGKKIGFGTSSSSEYVWSSSEYAYNRAWIFRMDGGADSGGLNYGTKRNYGDSSVSVRPVLAF